MGDDGVDKLIWVALMAVFLCLRQLFGDPPRPSAHARASGSARHQPLVVWSVFGLVVLVGLIAVDEADAESRRWILATTTAVLAVWIFVTRPRASSKKAEPPR